MIPPMRIPYLKAGKFRQMKQDPLLTQAKFTEFQRKLARLKSSRLPAAVDVKRLAETGDFSENAGYQAAKGRLRGINSGILNLENQLNQAIIIPPQKQTDRVRIGNTVTVAAGDKQKTYQILGSAETSPGRGIISHNSPIGAALIGCRVGDAVKIKLADKVVEYRILEIA